MGADDFTWRSVGAAVIVLGAFGLVFGFVAGGMEAALLTPEGREWTARGVALAAGLGVGWLALIFAARIRWL